MCLLFSTSRETRPARSRFFVSILFLTMQARYCNYSSVCHALISSPNESETFIENFAGIPRNNNMVIKFSAQRIETSVLHIQNQENDNESGRIISHSYSSHRSCSGITAVTIHTSRIKNSTFIVDKGTVTK